MPDFFLFFAMYEFSSRYPAAISILLLFAALGFSYFSYAKRELTRGTKIFLVAIRALAVFLLLLLFIEPSLVATLTHKQDIKTVVLIDNSRSLVITDAGGKLVSENVKDLLSWAGSFGKETKVFTFSSGIEKYTSSNPDSVSFTGFETNLSGSLDELRSSMADERINSVILISDGNFNSGDNPVGSVKKFQCPFVTIAAGDSVQKKDVLVTRVDHSSNSFVNVPSKVKAVLNAFGCNGTELVVNLLREGSVIAKRNVTVNSDIYTGDVDFDITESNPGIYKYTILVDEVKGEITTKNNSSIFFIRFADKLNKVLFVTGGPGYDNAVVSGIMKRLEQYKVSVFTLRTGSSFYEGNIDPAIYPELASVFFLNFPVSAVQPDLVNGIAEKVQKFRIPLVLFAGKNTDYQKLGRFEESLPFSISRSGSGEQQVSLQLVTSPDRSTDGQSTNLPGSFPNVFKNVSGIVQKTGSEVSYIDRNSGEPMLITRSNVKGNSTAFLGYGFWKWELNPGSANEKAIINLLTASISMSLNKDKKQRLITTPAKEEFDYTENAIITAKVLDDNYEQTQNAAVKGKLKGKKNSFSREITFTSSDNIFKAELGKLPPDDYTLETQAESGNSVVGNDEVRFTVDTTNTEYMKTKSDYASLRSIADNSGGEFHFIDQSTSLTDLIKSAQNRPESLEPLKKSEKFNFWESSYILCFVVLLLGTEWFIKKRKNIP